MARVVGCGGKGQCWGRVSWASRFVCCEMADHGVRLCGRRACSGWTLLPQKPERWWITGAEIDAWIGESRTRRGAALVDAERAALVEAERDKMRQDGLAGGPGRCPAGDGAPRAGYPVGQPAAVRELAGEAAIGDCAASSPTAIATRLPVWCCACSGDCQSRDRLRGWAGCWFSGYGTA